MFLIRTAFWLTLVILLLPTNADDQRQVYGSAEAAVKDMRSFCIRNPDVCDKSRDAFDVFSQKAQFGAKMLMNFVTEAASHVPSEDDKADSRRRFPAFFEKDSQNTLTLDDVEPGWAGPSRTPGV